MFCLRKAEDDSWEYVVISYVLSPTIRYISTISLVEFSEVSKLSASCDRFSGDEFSKVASLSIASDTTLIILNKEKAKKMATSTVHLRRKQTSKQVQEALELQD